MKLAELYLVRAILERALEDLNGRVLGSRPAARRRSIQSEALTWFLSSEKTLGSLEWVCDVLRLDATWVRQAAITEAALRDRTFCDLFQTPSCNFDRRRKKQVPA